jgi:uncharacterized repeat protein (TIGR03803 family)
MLRSLRIGAAAACFLGTAVPAVAANPKAVYGFTQYGAAGFDPLTGVVDVEGNLYGTTYYGGSPGAGAIYGVDPKTGDLTLSYSFEGIPDGATPVALINVKGTLFGLTEYGGSAGCGGYGCGTVFAFDHSTGAETILYRFTEGAGGGNPPQSAGSLISNNGVLYGVTCGAESGSSGSTIFSVDPSSGAEKTVYNFPTTNDACPVALTSIASTLYVAVLNSGNVNSACPYGCGTIIKVNLATGSSQLVYSFNDALDGAEPQSLIAVKGTLFGTTQLGGSNACPGGICGTVFKLDPKTGVESVLHAFSRTDGTDPEGQLLYTKGLLYGVTYGGGPGNSDCGTAYSVDPSTGATTILANFQFAVGCTSTAGLLKFGTTLYGTFSDGGPSGYGSVFGLKP